MTGPADLRARRSDSTRRSRRPPRPAAVIAAALLGQLAAACSSPGATGETTAPARGESALDAAAAMAADAQRETAPGPAALDGPAGDAGAPPGPVPPGAHPVPTRYVVLGDSIVACLGVGDKNAATCGPKKLHAYLAAGIAPGITYENLAISGANTADVPARELAGVTGGAGHLLVLIYVGGNDLRPYLAGLDAAAEAGFAKVVPEIEAEWKKVFDFFADRSKFPGGATLLMNNQYDPFDDCTAAPYFISATKHALLRSYNDVLAKLARDNGAVLTEQYLPYLGHGHHWAVATCPHYKAGSTPFMNDLIHPNPAGHEHLFAQWKQVLGALY